MRTAVTIPDALADDADKLAKHLGVSRSEFYARALADYMHRIGSADAGCNATSNADMTHRINEGLAKAGHDASELDDAWKASRNKVLAREDW